MAYYYSEDDVRKAFIRKLGARPKREIAEELGVSRQYVYRVITGQTRISQWIMLWAGFRKARNVYLKLQHKKEQS